MVTRKRNEFLDVEESDDEQQYDSEAEESRARLIPSKRRKLDHSASEDEIHDLDDNADDASLPLQEIDDVSEHELELSSKSEQTTKPVKPTKPKKDKSGVIYLSRVPPFMKPAVLRSLLTPYGNVNRIFLTPEDTTQRTSRLRAGGNRRKLFLDGWVEFVNKKDARFVAENLNAQIIGGKKRNRYHDEVWNIKYLNKVKWHHLTEQIKNENAERAARLRAEIGQTNRDNKLFLENLEKGKTVAGIESKKKAKSGNEERPIATEGEHVPERASTKAPRRTFRQNEVRKKIEKSTKPTDEVQNVLSKIF